MFQFTLEEAIAIRLEAIAGRLEAIALREAIASRLDSIQLYRMEAIALVVSVVVVLQEPPLKALANGVASHLA